MMLGHALCNMQLANLHSHTILNARVHCVNTTNLTLYFLYHYCLHCIVLYMQHLHYSLTRQGCCATTNFAHAKKQTVFADAKCNYSPGNPTYLVILYFLTRISGSCTIEDSAFTCAVSCKAIGSSPAAALLHSAPFSLPPCYFGA